MNLRHSEHTCDFGIGIALKEAEREDFGRARIQTCKGAAEGVAQFPGIVAGYDGFVQWHVWRALPQANDIHRRVNGGAAQVALLVFERLGRAAPPNQAKEDLLEHVFRISRVTGNAVGRAEDEPVALLEDPFDGAGSRDGVDLSEREFQNAPPVFSRLKTGYAADYYRPEEIIFIPNSSGNAGPCPARTSGVTT